MPNYRDERSGAGPSHQELSGSRPKTHEELVATFRAVIKTNTDPSISPEELLHHELVNMRHSSLISDEKAKFFERLEEAWEVLTCDRLPHESAIKRKVDGGLQVSYNRYRKPGPDNEPQSILDLNEEQVRALDAMAEAVGISRLKGQNKLPIPPKYADPWKLS